MHRALTDKELLDAIRVRDEISSLDTTNVPVQAQYASGRFCDVPLRSNKPRLVYVIGSLRNPCIPNLAECIRHGTGCDVFDDWYSAGPTADDHWKEYEQGRGHDYITALRGEAAKNVYAFDKRHLDAATDVVLVLPAGKSGHLELGYCAGKGKNTYILLEPDTDPRWDVMYQFADHVVETVEALVEKLHA